MGADLVHIQPFLKRKLEQLQALAKAKKINFKVTQGFRSIAEQNQLYEQGRSKPGNIVTNARGGSSYHNYGLAFDVVIVNPDGSLNWFDRCDTNHDGYADYYQLGVLGKSIGLEWGGDFKSFKDLPHFQLSGGLSCSQLKAGKIPVFPKGWEYVKT